jgi:hypothetical protein
MSSKLVILKLLILLFQKVLYNCEGFIEKNRDFLPNNLIYTARS